MGMGVSRGRRIWFGAGALLGAAALVLHLVRPGSDPAVLATVAAVAWGAVTAIGGVRWLWHKATYRVGVRLFISYLLIGVTPFLAIAIFASIGGYVLVGQYTSGRFNDRQARVYEDLEKSASAVAGGLAHGSPPSSIAAPPPLSRLAWVSYGSFGVRRSGADAPEALPGWAVGSTWSGPVDIAGQRYLCATATAGKVTAAVVTPMDLTAAQELSAGAWYTLRFRVAEVVRAAASAGDSGVKVQIGDRNAGSGGAGEGKTVTGGEGDFGPTSFHLNGIWSQPWIVWFHVDRPIRDWTTGEDEGHTRLLALIRTSPKSAFADLFTSPYQLQKEFSGMLTGLGLGLAILYAIAVGLAALMILSITRSASRLARGAREVADGHLDVRIPVRRRDQLGDLAVRFNTMTASIQRMLVAVAEKERLARELELAREIQESLLPARTLAHGDLTVDAHFRPAAEVGGDYFDLFPLPDGRLLVAIGDVAGHGVSTGLLMAMVKSAVAAFVREGHRGAALLERLNEVVIERHGGRRMVTLAVVEIDPATDRATVVSAGHPPAMVVRADGTVDEILISSLPLGYPWSDRAVPRTFAFPPGSRLALYTDGLVEARDAVGTAFGYEALAGALRGHPDHTGSATVADVLTAVDRHVGGGEWLDDMTVIVVTRASREGRA